MYCEFCNEENLKTYYTSDDIRPFEIFCSVNCMENLTDEIFNGEWDSHFDDNDEYKNELKIKYNNKTIKWKKHKHIEEVA